MILYLITPPLMLRALYQTTTKAKTAWRSPSNIALIKYWGKKPIQIPANPSVSFTLNHCASETTVYYQKRKDHHSEFSFTIFLDEKPVEAFKPKIEIFFKRIEAYLPFLREYHFNIKNHKFVPP